MQTLHAAQALTSNGWQSDVLVTIDDVGLIQNVTSGARSPDHTVDVLLPAPSNLHSHAFQRAMAGLTERRGPAANDSFWTWRSLMYKFLHCLTPDDIEAISAYAQVEMLEAGYASVAEFHYLHHQPDGSPYDSISETSGRIAAAAQQSGIGLTILPVLYQQGGCDGRALEGSQKRFENSEEQFGLLFNRAQEAITSVAHDTRVGVAAHSLRAVSRDGLTYAASLASDAPMHIHIAEQTAELDEVKVAFGTTPVKWLLDNQPVDERWCLVHATHMTPEETTALARSRAVAGICPITEANLGDGIFDGARFIDNGGRFGIGTDSNVRISLSEELRLLEYSQRLKNQARAILATPDKSNGRVLFQRATEGGAQATGRDAGAIEPGKYADLVALDARNTNLSGITGDTILDMIIFAADDRLVCDVWSAGRHVVAAGRHIHRDKILARFRKTMSSLKDRM